MKINPNEVFYVVFYNEYVKHFNDRTHKKDYYSPFTWKVKFCNFLRRIDRVLNVRNVYGFFL